MLKAKQIKQMQMDALEQAFKGVRDLGLISATGINAIAENKLRLDLRKKKIRLMQVKNSLARRVFLKMGMRLEENWSTEPTIVAWGSTSLSQLAKDVEASFMSLDKAKDKVKFKGALADGQPITWEQAKKMPTREEAIGHVVTLILSPGSRLVSQIKGPGGMLAGQVKSIADKEGDKAKEEQPAA
jgi:large subunit ribosomal protein L10